MTLAGFAGVVVVFRRESVHEWSPIDKFRLRLLLMNSVLPLALCMLGLLFFNDQTAARRHLEVVQRVCVCDFVLFAATSMKVFVASICANYKATAALRASRFICLE